MKKSVFKKYSGRLLSVVLVLAIMVSCFSGCSKSVNIDENGAADLQNYPVTVNEVTISSKPSKGVVIGSGIADAILAIGCETGLVAVTDDCTQEDFNTLTKISANDVDAIISLGADVVVAENLDDNLETKLSEAGIKVVEIVPADSRKDFERLYTQLGSIFGGAKDGYNKGLTAAQNLFMSLDDLSRIIPNSNNTIMTGCYIYDTTDKAVTGEHFASLIMEYAGITNVFKGSEGGVYDYENLRITNPNVIFCPVGVKNEIMKDSNFSELHAVQEDKVFEVDEKLLNMQGRSIIKFATEIAGLAFPELLEETSQAPTAPEVIPEKENELPEIESLKSPEPEEDEDDTDGEDGEDTENDDDADKPESTDDEDWYVYTIGDSGDDIIEVQERLEVYGYLTTEYDGYYGEVTAEAVKAFQTANGLEATGEVDKATYDKLMSSDAVYAEGAEN